MNPYSRSHPEFSLCGLNCSLCPRFRVTGTSRCPGCGEKDSFITYRKVPADMAKAKNNLAEYLSALKEKEALLAYLLENYDNGRMKSYYCLAVNLLEAEDIKDVLNDIRQRDEGDREDVIKEIKRKLEGKAKKRAIEIRLRK